MSSSSGIITKRSSNGSITELLRYPTAAVLLLDYQTGQTVRSLGFGLFFVNLIMQTASPIIMTVCSVNGFQWPLTKDTPVIRMSKRTFIFGLPGLLYALQFTMVCEMKFTQRLEDVFKKYGHYNIFGDSTTGGLDDNEPSFWKMVRPMVEPMAHELLSQFGHEPGRSRFSVLYYNSCYTRATRMSATTKIVAKALTSGALLPAHVTIGGTKGPYNQVFPSISVFTCLVDAVEASWLISCGIVPLILAKQPLQTYPGFRVWRLNEIGLVTLLKGLGSVAEHEAEMVSAASRTRMKNNEDKEKGDASASVVEKRKGKRVVKHWTTRYIISCQGESN